MVDGISKYLIACITQKHTSFILVRHAFMWIKAIHMDFLNNLWTFWSVKVLGEWNVWRDWNLSDFIKMYSFVFWRWKNSYRFETIEGVLNYDRDFIFRWTNPSMNFNSYICVLLWWRHTYSFHGVYILFHSIVARFRTHLNSLSWTQS